MFTHSMLKMTISDHSFNCQLYFLNIRLDRFPHIMTKKAWNGKRICQEFPVKI